MERVGFGDHWFFTLVDIFELDNSKIFKDLFDFVAAKLHVLHNFLELSILLLVVVPILLPSSIFGWNIDFFDKLKISDVVGLLHPDLIFNFVAESSFIVRQHIIFGMSDILRRPHFLVAPFCHLNLVSIVKNVEDLPSFEGFPIGFGVSRSMNVSRMIDLGRHFLFDRILFVHSFNLQLLNKVVLYTDLIIRLVHQLLEMLLPLPVAKRRIKVQVINLIFNQTFELSFGLHVGWIRGDTYRP